VDDDRASSTEHSSDDLISIHLFIRLWKSVAPIGLRCTEIRRRIVAGKRREGVHFSINAQVAVFRFWPNEDECAVDAPAASRSSFVKPVLLPA
jgi:hypothetical protein